MFKERSHLLWIYTGVFVLLISACKQQKSEVVYPYTLHIDTVDYKKIQNKYPGVYVYKLDDHLGGLTPNYPIALANQMLYDFHIASRDFLVFLFIWKDLNCDGVCPTIFLNCTDKC